MRNSRILSPPNTIRNHKNKTSSQFQYFQMIKIITTPMLLQLGSGGVRIQTFVIRSQSLHSYHLQRYLKIPLTLLGHIYLSVFKSHFSNNKCLQEVYWSNKRSLLPVSHTSTPKDRFLLTDYDHLSSNFLKSHISKYK